MFNRHPIFINALVRGGSNITMNLLMSHSDVCISSGETHKVFKGTKWDPLWRKVKKRILYDFPIRLTAGQDVFGTQCFEERRTPPAFFVTLH